MNSPQLENGYLQIANELAEGFGRKRIPGNEMQLVWCVIRKTWGWTNGSKKKDWDWISLTQFEAFTELNRKTVCRGLKSLVAKKILLKNVNSYKLNKKYSEWLVAKKPRVVANVVKGSGKCGQKVVAKKPHTKETLQKKLLQKKRYAKHNNVFLSEKEHSLLISKLGIETTETFIEKLSLYIGSKGDKYTSHYMAILSWIHNEQAKVALSKPRQLKDTMSCQ